MQIKKSYIKTNNHIAALLLIFCTFNSFTQCAYDYLSKAFYAPWSLKATYCDSAIQIDSTYIPAYAYMLKHIWFTDGDKDSIRKVVKMITDKAWSIDSQYITVYEFKYILDGWDKIDKAIYRQLQGEIRFKKELHFNDINLQCKPHDSELFLERAGIYLELGMYDSALILVDNAYSCCPDSVLKLKENIFIKTKNKPGMKHIKNDLESLNWQKEYLWINKVENDIAKTSDDCCIRIYCRAIENSFKETQFKDLKIRCKKIMNKFRHLKPFSNRECNSREDKCGNLIDYY